MTVGRIEFVEVWKKFHYGEMNNRLRDAIPALAARLLGRRDPDEGLWKETRGMRLPTVGLLFSS